ncbi:MAG: hypothetical protein ACLTOV_05510 [Phocaeicola sp.]
MKHLPDENLPERKKKRQGIMLETSRQIKKSPDESVETSGPFLLIGYLFFLSRKIYAEFGFVFKLSVFF